MNVERQISTHTSANRKRNAWIIFSCVLIFIIAIYFFVFDLIVPKAAVLAVPQKWHLIPIRQPKSTAHNYFGEPLQSDSTSETWENGGRERKYILRLYISDTVVTGYSIHYKFKNAVASRDYVIDTFSIRE